MIELTEKTTYGEKYGPAMEMTDEEEARAYFERCVDHQMRIGGYSREEAETIERKNLAYWAGYGDNDLRIRVERLFHCSHPIFGKASEGAPTPEEAFKMGQEFAK